MSRPSSPTPEVCVKQVAYLAGPMRGYAEYNFPAFHAAAAKLRGHGLEVWSPAENDVNQDGFDPAKDTAQPMKHYMKRDLPAVLNADMVCVLPGWEKSQGACLEVHVARTCGIPVYWAATMQPVAVSERATPEDPAVHGFTMRDAIKDGLPPSTALVLYDDYFALWQAQRSAIADTVPRSRYDACNADWLAEKAKVEKKQALLTRVGELLSKHLTTAEVVQALSDDALASYNLPETDCVIHGKLGSTDGECPRC